MSALFLAFLFIGGSIVYATAGVIVTRTFVKPHVREGHNDVLVPIFLTAGVIYAVLLGFMVVAVWESYDAAHANVAEEAATLVPLYRQTTVMAPAKGKAMQALIRQYDEDVVDDEWKSLETTGKASTKARHDVGSIFRVYGTLRPATKVRELIAAQFLSTLSEIIADRNRRVLQASESLNWIMWLGAAGGGAIVVGMSFFLFMEVRWPQIVMVSVMASLIGLLLFMMLVLSKPFSGPLAIESSPFEASMSAFTDIDHGN